MRNRLAMLWCLAPVWACAQQTPSVTEYGVVDLAALADSGKGATGADSGIFNLQLARRDASDAAGLTVARSTMVGGNIGLGPLRGWLAATRNTSDLAYDMHDTRDLLVGVSLPLGLNRLSADYTFKTDRYNLNAGARQITAGYSHWLSKRTNLYLVSSRLRNGSAANYQTTLPGGSRRVIAAGVRFQF